MSAAVPGLIVRHGERRVYHRRSHDELSRRHAVVHGRWAGGSTGAIGSQLTKGALLMVQGCRDRVGVHGQQSLEVVGLNVMRSYLKGVAGFLVERLESEELADGLATASC